MIYWVGAILFFLFAVGGYRTYRDDNPTFVWFYCGFMLLCAVACVVLGRVMP